MESLPHRPAAPAAKIDAGEFIFRSVLDGLADDGVPPALAKALAGNGDFVKKCGICGMTRKALFVHGELKMRRNRRPTGVCGRTWRSGSMSNDEAVRRDALRELIQRYIEFGHAGLDVAAEQKNALQSDLETMRKDAMGGLEKGRSSAPPAMARAG